MRNRPTEWGWVLFLHFGFHWTPRDAQLTPTLASPRRFHRCLANNPQWVRERSHEAYAKNYSVVFPYDEPLAGRNLRKDPLYEVGPQSHGGDPWAGPGHLGSGKA